MWTLGQGNPETWLKMPPPPPYNKDLGVFSSNMNRVHLLLNDFFMESYRKRSSLDNRVVVDLGAELHDLPETNFGSWRSFCCKIFHQLYPIKFSKTYYNYIMYATSVYKCKPFCILNMNIKFPFAFRRQFWVFPK